MNLFDFFSFVVVNVRCMWMVSTKLITMVSYGTWIQWKKVFRLHTSSSFLHGELVGAGFTLVSRWQYVWQTMGGVKLFWGGFFVQIWYDIDLIWFDLIPWGSHLQLLLPSCNNNNNKKNPNFLGPWTNLHSHLRYFFVGSNVTLHTLSQLPLYTSPL